MNQKERASQLSQAHWGYIEKLLKHHGTSEANAEIIGFHYRTAMEHGYGHGVEDQRNGMFPQVEIKLVDSGYDPYGRPFPFHDFRSHGAVNFAPPGIYMHGTLCQSCDREGCAKGQYPATKDGGCEGYISALRENMLDAKQDAPTAAELPITHTDPSTNCKDCGNAACNGMGRNLTCDQGCERFTPKATLWTRYDIWQKIEMENARSKEIHGSWHQYTPQEQREAIRNEYFETKEAFKLGDVDGTHGEVAELIQLANLCFRRIQFLKGEADA